MRFANDLPLMELMAEQPLPPASPAPGPSPRSTAAMTQPVDGEAEAVFVVGVSRSGTTLLRRVLETSPRVGIAGENHYMGHLIWREGSRHYFAKLGDLHDDATVRRVVDFIYSGEYHRRSKLREPSHYWTWLVKHVPADDFAARLLAEERTQRGVLRAMMRAYSDVEGRAVIGEKSPPHLWYVETLLEWFPGGRVIHMVRDPRAVYVSEVRRRRERPKKPFSWIMKVPYALETVLLLQTTMVWAAAEARHRTLRRRFPDRYMALRFEDLVQDSRRQLPLVFGFIGVETPPDPTDVKVVSQGYRLGDAGLDSGAASRWRQHIGPFADRWMRFFLGPAMRRFGYLPGRGAGAGSIG